MSITRNHISSTTVTMVGMRILLLATALLSEGVLCNPSFKTGPIPHRGATAGAPSAQAKQAAGKPQAKLVPTAYIVQLKAEGPLTKRAADLHDDFHLRARGEAGLDYTIRETFSEDSLFVGLSLNLNGGDLQALKDLKNVAAVWPIHTIARPSAAIQRKSQSNDALLPRADDALPYIAGDLDVNRPHAMTGVDKAHAAGIKGKGIKIAIIDTGVDYMHPSLGGGFGPGFKIAFGYDFVGDDYDPENGVAAVEKPDPLTTCKSTSVSASIICLERC